MQRGYRFTKEYALYVKKTNQKSALARTIASLLSRRRVPLSICDLGCGDGALLRSLISRIGGARVRDVTLVDMTPSLLRLATLNVRNVVKCPVKAHLARIEEWIITQRNVAWDVILASHVLYYMRARTEALRQWADCLSPHGLLVVVARFPDDDSFQIRRICRTASARKGGRVLGLHETLKSIANAGLEYRVHSSRAYILLPEGDVRLFVSRGSKVPLEHNVTARLIKFIGHGTELTVSPVVLRRVSHLLATRKTKDGIRLRLHNAVIVARRRI
jgi:trans-aconitate methyltransferase